MDRKMKRYLCIGGLFVVLVMICSVCLPGGGGVYREWWNPVFSFHIKNSSMVLEVGQSEKIKVVAVNQRIRFQSKDFKVAEVDRNGRVTGRRTGTTVIYVKGKKTLACKVTVVGLSREKVTMKVGGHVSLKVRGTWSRPHYRSMNRDIAVVDYRGKITGKKRGSCKIVCTVKGKSLVCVVHVR